MAQQMPTGMPTQMSAGMPAQMPSGYTWNGTNFSMMGDPMSNMMYNNQAIMAANNSTISGNDSTDSRNRRRTRSRSRDRSRSRERSNDRRGTKRKSEGTKTSDTSSNMTGMNPMMMNNMMAGNMMTGGMYPNMMMGAYPGGMMAPTGMDMMPATGGMDMMGQSQMDMMSSSTSDMTNMMMPMMDPSMMAMGMTVPMGGEVKELVLKNCKLTPPPIGTPLPPRRIKPSGCRTIFIGGLPEKTTEANVREIFERFGRIYTLRLSKKNFCHIRYDRESSVDMAIALSGYKLKLKLSEKDEENEVEDKNNSGYLHVDYALSRDDQNEFERRQKRMEREAAREMAAAAAIVEVAPPRGRDARDARDARDSRDVRAPRYRSPSPMARIQPYSAVIVQQISEKIRSEEHFASAAPTLLAWLERGECQKKNAGTFYAMIQATNGQIRRLFNEKMQCDEELQSAKERIKKSYQRVVFQLEQVAKVLAAAAHQRVWDHFTKPQRKNIETWQKMTEEFQSIKDEFLEKFGDEDEYGDEKVDTTELKKLKRENEKLQVQLEAYKNEVELMKADTMKDFEKFKAQFIATQALNSMNNHDVKPLSLQPQPPAMPVVKPQPPPPPPPPVPADDKGEVVLASDVDPASGEAKLIGVMAAFLQVHPRGASLDYVVSYVRAQFPSVNQATVHHVLARHADVFQCSTSGVGAGIEHRWKFVAFGDN